MPKMESLASEMKSQLSSSLSSFVEEAGKLAAARGRRLYLVGGAVRDLLLHRENLDLDLVIEGEAIAIARVLAEKWNARVTAHPAFNTAKLEWQGGSADIATMRSESYSRPGALPTVSSGTLATDLFRRDFTVNAIALELTADKFGELVDLYGGIDDLERKIIRVLHDRSFIDDATRMWRALRYEQRLGFHIETHTENLISRDAAMLETITGDRIRHEIELVWKEDRPERILSRADHLALLANLGPSLRADAWLGFKFRQARKLVTEEAGLDRLYLSLFLYRLELPLVEAVLARLNPSSQTRHDISDTLQLKANLELLSLPRLSPSRLAFMLRGLGEIAILANLIATDSLLLKRRMRLFLDALRHVKPELNGDDLIEMGIAHGPRIKAVLNTLLDARLDGTVSTREEEVRLAKHI
jgi:tRNA nucleotidyltransferase (CCA-adding enzyme)